MEWPKKALSYSNIVFDRIIEEERESLQSQQRTARKEGEQTLVEPGDEWKGEGAEQDDDAMKALIGRVRDAEIDNIAITRQEIAALEAARAMMEALCKKHHITQRKARGGPGDGGRA